MINEGNKRRIAALGKPTPMALPILGFLALTGALLTAGCDLERSSDGAAQASAMAASISPEPLRGLPGYALEPIEGPLRIGIQPGHWRVNELPEELARLRTSTGASYGSLKEVDLNLAVARLLVDRLTQAGHAAELVSAAVPAGYRSDLFISIHADRADKPDRRGWKLAPPWRPSPRSRELAEALSSAFRASGLAEDSGGVTANMRGYFSFSWWRFSNTLSPYTPAALVEMGFLGNTADRERMRDNPALYAEIILEGIQTFISDYDRNDLDSLIPTLYQTRFVGPEGTLARAGPAFDTVILERYEQGRLLRPVDSASGGWLEVFSRPLRRGVWVHESDLE